jgi:hypothetical protein
MSVAPKPGMHEPVPAAATASRFPVLALMSAMKAARDFGLGPDAAEAIALAYDPREGSAARAVDALSRALLEGDAVRVPDFV